MIASHHDSANKLVPCPPTIVPERLKSVRAESLGHQAHEFTDSTESVLPLGAFMKWFEHETQTLNDEKVNELMFEHGLAGYGCYMALLELVAEKLDQRSSPELTITWRVLARKLHTTEAKLKHYLQTLGTLALLEFKTEKLEVQIKIPNLLKRLDNYLRRIRSHSVASTDIQYNTIQDSTIQDKRVQCTASSSSVTFHAPTLAEVTEAFKVLIESDPHRWPFVPTYEAEQFFHHYESNGWRVSGRAPMRKWQSAMRTWLARSRTFSQHTPSNPPRPSYDHPVVVPTGEHFQAMPPPEFTALVEAVAKRTGAP